jgi:hypothetical protein
MRDQRPGLDHAGATDRRGRGVSEPGQADRPGPGARAQVWGREECEQIQIGVLRLDPH